jgi:hypothetical protein
MRATRSDRERVIGCVWLLACALLGGCYRDTKLVTVTFTDRSGNSEYWVCPARKAPDAGSCHGRQEGDIDDAAYAPGLDVLAPAAECPNGVAKLEIMVRKDQVLRVGYECALPLQPPDLPQGTPLPDGLPVATEQPTGGVPVDAPAAGELRP